MRLGLHTMRTAVNFGSWGSGMESNLPVVQLAERLGYDSVWTAEASGTDAVVPLTWLAAHTTKIRLGTGIMQLSARAPTTTAMTAVTLDMMSRGRFLLGLGASGPAVVEGWHSQRYGDPLEKMREYVGIVREVFSRGNPVVRHGEYYDIPYTGAGATGLADPIRLMVRPRRQAIPIYIAAMGPRNVKLAFDIADGVIPAYYSPYNEEPFLSLVPEDRRASIDVAPFVPVSIGKDAAACRDRLRPGLAFWLGGMGARGLNFYNNLVCRLGYEEAATKIQKLYAEGRTRAAAQAIPDALIDEVALCGPSERIAERLEAWRRSHVTTMIISTAQQEAVTVMAELVL